MKHCKAGKSTAPSTSHAQTCNAKAKNSEPDTTQGMDEGERDKVFMTAQIPTYTREESRGKMCSKASKASVGSLRTQAIELTPTLLTEHVSRIGISQPCCKDGHSLPSGGKASYAYEH